MNKFIQRVIRGGWRRICKPWIAIYNYLFNRPIGYVYMFHMVRPKENYGAMLDTLRVSPEFFEKFLTEKKEQIDFVSVDEMVERMHAQKKGRKPFGVVTFDDGYDDNFVYAYPILKKLQIPFTIYVTVNFINEGQRIWNYPFIIDYVIHQHDRLVLGNGKVYSCETEKEKDATYCALVYDAYMIPPYEQVQSEFQKKFAAYLTDDVFPKNTMTWEQIEQLAKDPLCTIGAHTMSHHRLNIYDIDSITYELKESKDILSKRVGRGVVHMSYPSGCASKCTIHLAESVGYKTAFQRGGVIRQKESNFYTLPRINVLE